MLECRPPLTEQVRAWLFQKPMDALKDLSPPNENPNQILAKSIAAQSASASPTLALPHGPEFPEREGLGGGPRFMPCSSRDSPEPLWGTGGRGPYVFESRWPNQRSFRDFLGVLRGDFLLSRNTGETHIDITPVPTTERHCRVKWGGENPPPHSNQNLAGHTFGIRHAVCNAQRHTTR